MLGLGSFKELTHHGDNLYFDTSGSERVRGEDILETVNSFGYQHVVFGSGTPYASLEDHIRKVENLNLPDHVKEHIVKLNAEHLLCGGS